MKLIKFSRFRNVIFYFFIFIFFSQSHLQCLTLSSLAWLGWPWLICLLPGRVPRRLWSVYPLMMTKKETRRRKKDEPQQHLLISHLFPNLHLFPSYFKRIVDFWGWEPVKYRPPSPQKPTWERILPILSPPTSPWM